MLLIFTFKILEHVTVSRVMPKFKMIITFIQIWKWCRQYEVSTEKSYTVCIQYIQI